MDAPPVQYVKTRDGYDIAYAISGEGPPLVFTGANLSDLQGAWKLPRLRAWLECLAARFRLVQFDCRGTGSSSRNLRNLHVEDYQRDMDAVIQQLNLDRFILFGHTFLPNCIAAQYAVQNPERVLAIILAGTVTTLGSQRAPALFHALPNQDWDLFLRTLVQVGQNPENAAEAETMVQLWGQAYDQRNFLLMVDAANRFSLEDWLARLASPTLILSTRRAGLYPLDEAMKVARLARAKLVSLDGQPSLGDPEEGVRAIEAFLAALPSSEDRSAAEAGGDTVGLSSREIEVLRLLAAGKSNQQIADELVISLNTVRRHVSNVFDKTGVANRTQAAAYARDHGLV